MIKTTMAALGLALFAFPALAAGQTCGDRQMITDRLSSKYSESHRASGLQSQTKMVEIWTSRETGTWTILVTDATGRTCIAAAGQSWLDMPDANVAMGTAS